MWASAPGQTISDLLAGQGISHAAFAKAIGESIEFVARLLAGETHITADIAGRLQQALGVPAHFWIRREAQFRDAVHRRESANSLESKKAWLRSLPINDMVAFGWLPALSADTDDATRVCLEFFGEPDLASWNATHRDATSNVAFRTSMAFESHATAVAAWLRKGAIEAGQLSCDLWRADRFASALSEVRHLTREKDPAVFIPALQAICAGCGVAVVIVRAPSGCRASGATTFLSPEKAMLMLSFRYLSDDHFWFTFFHEAGHLLLHSGDETFLEGVSGNVEQIEQEANQFAARTLIPAEFEQALINLPLDGREVVRFATRIGISPGIVVGQLQHRERITRKQLNALKRRYTWA